jgi:hypothetical protein
MTVISPWIAAQAWLAGGGHINATAMWVAVGVSESSLNTDAVSPTDARGIWQIEPYSWPRGAGPISNWANPNSNAAAAVILSGGGVNFAPWDTAYRNIYQSGRYSYLHWPEPGSAAANNLPWVLAHLGTRAFGTEAAPAEPGLANTLPQALAWYAAATNFGLPVLNNQVKAKRAATRRLF